MIEETARVVALEDDFAWVETQRKSTCGACAVNKGCGTAALAKVLGARRTRIKVLNSPAAAVGDEVVIGLGEHAIVQGSLAMYAAPLAFMLAAALLDEGLSARLGMTATEGLTILFGLGGLAGGFAWLRHYAKKIAKDPRYQPVILRRAGMH
jgi:sigma-E factor negative regulatory protein RseC